MLIFVRGGDNIHTSTANETDDATQTGDDEMFYAIRKNPNNTSLFFDYDTETGKEFQTREEIEKAIAVWKSRVTPRMAEGVVFEIFQR